MWLTHVALRLLWHHTWLHWRLTISLHLRLRHTRNSILRLSLHLWRRHSWLSILRLAISRLLRHHWWSTRVSLRWLLSIPLYWLLSMSLIWHLLLHLWHSLILLISILLSMCTVLRRIHRPWHPRHTWLHTHLCCLLSSMPIHICLLLRSILLICIHCRKCVVIVLALSHCSLCLSHYFSLHLSLSGVDISLWHDRVSDLLRHFYLTRNHSDLLCLETHLILSDNLLLRIWTRDA